jgi:hypothetical protein
MAVADFAVLIIGADENPRLQELETELARRTSVLAGAGERIDFVRQGSHASVHRANKKAAVVFCRGATTPAEDAAVAWCVQNGLTVFPVVEDLTLFSNLAPDALKSYNGFELKPRDNIGELAGLVLETLGLQRSKRKIFISYARRDSAAIAHQLHEALVARWYRVFQDTVSIRPGAAFQEELMQELSDSDVMLLLNSPSVPSRPYVRAEIAFADQAGVGGVQVVWPGVQPLGEAGFFMRIQLQDSDWQPEPEAKGTLGTYQLSADRIREILDGVAAVRTEVQKHREQKIVDHVKAHLNTWTLVLHQGRFIALEDAHKRRVFLDLALGLPTSHDLHQACIAARKPPPCTETIRVLYDPFGITNEQARHLEFLRTRLNLELLDHRKADQWSAQLP